MQGEIDVQLSLTTCCNPDCALLQYTHGQRSAAPEVIEGNDNDQRQNKILWLLKQHLDGFKQTRTSWRNYQM